MTLFPAIIVFAVVFLFFSKDVFSEEKAPKKPLRPDGAESASMSDVLLRYKLMNELGENSQGKRI